MKAIILLLEAQVYQGYYRKLKRTKHELYQIEIKYKQVKKINKYFKHGTKNI